MKDEKMKCVSGGALNSPLDQDIIENIRHEIVKVIVKKDVANALVAALSRYKTVNEILDSIESPSKIEGLLKMYTLKNLDREDVESILRLREYITKHYVMNKVAGGANLDYILVGKRPLSDADYSRIANYINSNMAISPEALTAVINRFKSLGTIDPIKRWISDYNSVAEVLSPYYPNKVELDSVAKNLSMIIYKALSANLSDVNGGKDVSAYSRNDIPLTDEMVSEIAMKFNEFLANPIINLNVYGSNLSHLTTIIKEYGTVRNLYNAFRNRTVVSGIFQELGYPVSDSNVNTAIDIIMPCMKVYLYQFLRK